MGEVIVITSGKGGVGKLQQQISVPAYQKPERRLS